MSKIEELKKAMMKKALGYEAEEVVEEYAKKESEDNDVQLSKRKVTIKHVPPDLTAIKWMMEYLEEPLLKTYQSMSKEELRKEKIKLLELLEVEDGNKSSKNRN